MILIRALILDFCLSFLAFVGVGLVLASAALATAPAPPATTVLLATIIIVAVAARFANALSFVRLLCSAALRFPVAIGVAMMIPASATPPAAFAAAALVTVFFAGFGRFVVGLDLFLDLVIHVVRQIIRRDLDGLGGRTRCGTAFLDNESLAGQGGVGLNHDLQAEPFLDVAQSGALGIENVDGNAGRAAHDHIVARIAHRMILDAAEDVQRNCGIGAYMTSSATMRADVHRALDHRGTDALARHLHQPEMRYPADLYARPVVLERILQPLLYIAVVALFLHVDEVDHDQPGKVAQAQLASNFVGSLQIGLVGSILDGVFAGGPAGVYVDSDKRLCLVDDEIAAGFERDLCRQQPVELLFNAVA